MSLPLINMSMKDKVIAVTGGASGIGLSLCKLLSSRGAIVCIADISSASIESTDAYFAKLNVPYTISQVDVSKRDQVDSWVESIIAKYKQLDGAANCAAIVGKHHGIRAVSELDDDEWDKIMNVNLKGMMFCLRAELRVISDSGSIVNIASVLGQIGQLTRPPNSTKWR
jgi:NAD(P)-dependent dehydrogenase (short-subunit alcohol dehydrogenase family)